VAWISRTSETYSFDKSYCRCLSCVYFFGMGRKSFGDGADEVLGINRQFGQVDAYRRQKGYPPMSSRWEDPHHCHHLDACADVCHFHSSYICHDVTSIYGWYRVTCWTTTATLSSLLFHNGEGLLPLELLLVDVHIEGTGVSNPCPPFSPVDIRQSTAGKESLSSFVHCPLSKCLC